MRRQANGGRSKPPRPTRYSHCPTSHMAQHDKAIIACYKVGNSCMKNNSKSDALGSRGKCWKCSFTPLLREYCDYASVSKVTRSKCSYSQEILLGKQKFSFRYLKNKTPLSAVISSMKEKGGGKQGSIGDILASKDCVTAAHAPAHRIHLEELTRRQVVVGLPAPCRIHSCARGRVSWFWRSGPVGT